MSATALLWDGIGFGEEERRRSGFGAGAERGDHVRLGVEFGRVARAERVPACDVLAVPFAERDARRDSAQPHVDRGFFLLDPARPQPVDQDAVAIARGRRLVYAFDLDQDAVPFAVVAPWSAAVVPPRSAPGWGPGPV